MRQLVIGTLRMLPTRIIIGETRDGAILEALKAFLTGHRGGMSTLHANNAVKALQRIELLIREVSRDPLPELIAETINVIIHIERLGDEPHRQVTDVSKVVGYRQGRYELQPFG